MHLAQIVLVSAAILACNAGMAREHRPDGQTEQSSPTDHHLVGCPDSPIPGKRAQGMDCAIIARTLFDTMPRGSLVLRVENFPTRDEAQKAAASTSSVVEARNRIWLLTLDVKGHRSRGGSLVAEIGPLPSILAADKYEMQVADADFGPEMNQQISKAVHTHSGPEIWYVLTGEQCLETPDGLRRASAGQGMFAPAETPMQLNITGTGKREALFLIVHDAAKPATTVSDWRPKGTCTK
jgi:hypothetical protein